MPTGTLRFPYGLLPYPQLEAKLREDPEYRKALHAKAEEAAEFARQFAPYDTGAYHDSIHVRESLEGPALVASDYKAFWIEWGTGEPGPTPAFAPLRRGLRAAGAMLENENERRATITEQPTALFQPKGRGSKYQHPVTKQWMKRPF